MADKNLEKEIRSLRLEVQRLKDLHEVQEVMSLYFHWHTAGLHGECYDKLFAQKAPDVSAEIANWGKWEGSKAVKSFYHEVLTGNEGDRIGQMFVHTLDTPSIQIAGDGKTAKGVWYSPGHETVKINNELKAHWCWSYIGTDFIREDGKWKMWHYHCYAMFKTPFEKSWVDYSREEKSPVPAMPKSLAPNKSYTYYNGYSPTSVRELVPAPPEPYETFDPSNAY